MAFWQNLGRALQNVWDTITHPESPPEPVEFEEEDEQYEEPTPRYEQGPFADFIDELAGDFFEPPAPEPEYTSPDEVPEGPFIYHERMGPYLDEWGDAEIRFWEKIVKGHGFEDEDEYQDAMDAFDNGWIRADLDKDDRKGWRNEFMDEMDMYYFDWDAYREYYEEH